MNQRIEQLKEQREVRENLSELYGLLKTNGADYLSPEEWEALILMAKEFFAMDDAKVRKNAAKLFTGFHETDCRITECLVDAYRKETVLFVRSAYLNALKGRDTEAFRTIFTERMKELQAADVTDETRKHLNEEYRALQELCGTEKEVHAFCGDTVTNEVLLVVNPKYRDSLYEAVEEPTKKIVAGGVLVRTGNVKRYRSVRYVRDILFLVPGHSCISEDPYKAAAILGGDDIYAFIGRRLSGSGTYRYRIDFRCRDEHKKAQFVKRLSMETDRISKNRLRNSTGDYELEFRITETKEDTLRLFLIFKTMQDTRFEYRKGTVAGSIHPTDAAYVIEWAGDYLRDNAQVLDPFCGVGTMLKERAIAGPIKTAFGVDRFADAVKQARINVTDDNIMFINRDFFDYKQDHMFDEVITNMPFTTGENETEIRDTYRRFFKKLPVHLRKNGILILISHDPDFVDAYMTDDLEVIKRISLKENDTITASLIRFRQEGLPG